MKKILDTTRIFALIISLVGGGFKLLYWPGANLILLLGLSSLALCHFLRLFSGNDLNRKEKIIHYLSNFSIAVLVLGVLFTLLHWPNGKQMVTVGIVTWALSYAVEFFMPAENNNQSPQ